MIHLICGPIGAGKTTFAHTISKQKKAVCFTEDEWLNRLFVPDAPDGLLDEPMTVVGAWASEKYQRCREQIWTVCEQLLKQNISIVLDGAAANKEQRDLIRKKAKDNGTGFQLYYVISDIETRRKRVLERNEARGETYSLRVTPEIFNHTESFFVPPAGDELTEIISVET